MFNSLKNFGALQILNYLLTYPHKHHIFRKKRELKGGENQPVARQKKRFAMI